MCRSDRPPCRLGVQERAPCRLMCTTGPGRCGLLTAPPERARRARAARGRTFRLDDARPGLVCTPGAPDDGSGSQGNSGYPLDDEDIAGSGNGAPHRGCLTSPA